MKNFLKIMFIALLSLAACNSSKAQAINYGANLTAEMKNISHADTDSISFDIYIINLGPDSLRFQSLGAGINFNFGGLGNGGVITAGMVSGTYDHRLPSSQHSPTVTFDTLSQQMKIQYATVSVSSAAPIPVTTGIKLGHFYIKNSVPFSAGTPNLSWNFRAGTYLKVTQLGAFVGDSSNPPVFPTTSSNVTKSWRFFAVGNPTFH